MSTPYTGNPASTQAPAPAPSPGSVPIVSLPVDGDPDSGSTFAQAFKCLCDYIAYEQGQLAGVSPTLRTWSGPTIGGNSPQLGFQDSAGNLRSLIDHSGYPMGRRFDEREDWQYNTGTIAATAAPIAAAPKWSASILTGNITPIAPSATYPAPFLQLNSGAGLGRAVIYSANTIVHTGFTGLSMVIEWEAGATGGADSVHVVQTFMGLSDTFGPPVINSGNYILFRNLSNGTSLNWLADTCSAGTATSVDTGATFGLIPTNSFPAQRFRIEIYGSASPYGSKVRFFINETLVATATTNIPAAAMYLVFASTSAASGNPISIWLGGIQAAFNRALSVAAL